jgi:hypothetical protein
MYDIFYVSQIDKNFNQTWKEFKTKYPVAKYAASFQDAQKKSLTKFFWIVWDDLLVNKDFKFDYEPDIGSSEYIHVFLNNKKFDGICLIPKNTVASDREIKHRFFINKKEVDVISSNPAPYNRFEIDSYDDYLSALENSSTEMFWGIPSDVVLKNNLDLYFDHHNQYDRNITHTFLNDKTYDGVVLYSKNVVLSKKEIEYKHPVNKKEHEEIYSIPKSFDLFEIDSYDDYLLALENSSTEMFWMSSRNISVKQNLIESFYISHHNTIDRKQNHVFVHQVGDKKLYNGLFLCSKHSPLTKKEVEHRHPVNRKEWDVVGSGPVKYEVFEIDSYDEYLLALENSSTEMFWGILRPLVIKDRSVFDLYFSHDNAHDRNQNHAFLHQVNEKLTYDSLFLFSKNAVLSKKEIEYKHIVNRKEWEIIATGPKPYDQFEIDSYDEYLSALENSTTEMFWMSSRNISAKIPDIFFEDRDESCVYDRNENHVFVHQVGNRKLYNGLFLCSKHSPLTKKEVEHRHLVNRKEWDVVGSGPVKYEVFEIDSYDEYLLALENSSTEMFWIIPNYVNASKKFNFDTYFSHDRTYERSINHVYLNKKYYDGIVLCSKHSRFSQREFDYRFISHKKEWPAIISTPKPYDVVFISYKESNADKNYNKLLKKCPMAKHVHGVKGIHQAHIAAAKLCNTNMLWIVDGDAEILDEFEFDYQVARWNQDTVHVWRSQNPINDLVYGYGGVKLLPRIKTIKIDINKPDMTTSISSKFKVVQETSNITAFNTDPYNTWKSAFRECVKLSSKIINRQDNNETQERLDTWCSVGAEKPYGSYAILGAQQGKEFGLKYKDNVDQIKLINNFDWLYEQFSKNSI